MVVLSRAGRYSVYMTFVNAKTSAARGRARSSRAPSQGPEPQGALSDCSEHSLNEPHSGGSRSLSVHIHEGRDCAQAHNLTPARRKIFDALVAAGAPLGAYDLIERLASQSGKRPAPISVYRALDYLVDRGLVHRLVSRSAYLPCAGHHSRAEAAVFLICDACGGVTEAMSADIAADISAVAEKCDFQSDFFTVEIVGRCGSCRERATPTAS